LTKDINLGAAWAEEKDRLTKAILDTGLDNMSAGTKSHSADWYEGDVLAQAKDMNIEITAPFDSMDFEHLEQL